MRYDDQTVEKVQSLNDIVEIVSSYFPLKRAGRNFKANCPFHQEKTPSFMVNPERQIFHCFGCGVGGDVFSFLMKYENLTFPEALKQLADRAGVQLPERTSARQESSLAGKLFEIYEAAAQYYRRNLEDKTVGREARAYLESRGFDIGALGEFGVGYALPEWRGLYDFLSRKGFSEDLLLKSGLIVRAPQGNLYDLFRKRVMFPIFNVRGKVMAMGGRVISKEDSPKYINSPETEIFQKRKEFYGLYLAKRFITAEDPRVFIVEGYLDQLRLCLAGFKNTVATLGTALTIDHLRILKRYAAEAVLVYDGDKAGEGAALRGLELFLEEGLGFKLLALPDGMDPDDLIRAKGAEAFRALADQAQDFFDFKLTSLRRRFKKDDSLGIVRMTNEFLETFDKIQDPILLDCYIRKLSLALNIHEDSIRQEVSKRRKKEKVSASGKPEEQKQPAILEQEEVILLSLMLLNAGIRDSVFERVAPEELRNPECRKFFSEVRSAQNSGGKISFPALLNRIADPELKISLSRLSFVDLGENDLAKAVEDCVAKIKRRNTQKNMSDLQMKIKQAEARGAEQEVLAYMREYQSLLEALR
ncbi:MAG TPA: DNA primase [Candidatus Omnitrophota bacterium]|nr:DNA primase [Candidatus Omnitrophota bacterium]